MISGDDGKSTLITLIGIRISYLFGVFSHLSSGHLQQQSLSQHIQRIHDRKWMFRPFHWQIILKWRKIDEKLIWWTQTTAHSVSFALFLAELRQRTNSVCSIPNNNVPWVWHPAVLVLNTDFTMTSREERFCFVFRSTAYHKKERSCACARDAGKYY